MKTYVIKQIDRIQHQERRKGASLAPPPLQRKENNKGTPDNFRYLIKKRSGMAAQEKVINGIMPIQMVAVRRHFRRGRTRYASYVRRDIGSVYAQDSRSQYNRGHRIRLEHPRGPHLSRHRSYRYREFGGVRTLLNAGRVGHRSGRLVETRRRGGPITHRSRGVLGRMQALTDAQANALYNLAQASDLDRGNIGPGLLYPNTVAHAAVHNQNVRILLRSPLFAGHPLQAGQLRRDATPGAPIP